MTSESELPTAHTARRVIVVLDDVTYDQLEMDGSRDLLVRSDVALINADAAVREGEGLISRLVDRGLLRPGRILVQSPYRPDEYADAETAVESFAMDKVTRMSSLASLLGAKKLQLTSVTEENSKSHWDAAADGSRPGFKGTVKASGDRAASFARKVKFEDTFTGSPPDIEGARQHLVDCNLDGDRELVSLVEARAVANNTHTKRTFSVDLSSESESRLNAAVEVGALPVLKGKATFAMSGSSRSHYRVEYTINY